MAIVKRLCFSECKLWLSGPKRDRTEARYGHGAPAVDDDARADYEASLDGAPLPGHEHG